MWLFQCGDVSLVGAAGMRPDNGPSLCEELIDFFLCAEFGSIFMPVTPFQATRSHSICFSSVPTSEV